MGILRHFKNRGLLLFLVPAILCSACDLDIYAEDDHGYVASGYVYEEYEEYEEYAEYEESVEEDVDAEDVSGGLDYWPDYYKGDFRAFYGSYRLNDADTTCNDQGYDDPGLKLPSILNVYSYENMMDFETSSEDLAWNATIHGDGTFAFETNYLDGFGDPSVTFPCECAVYNEGWSDEFIECSCEPSNSLSTCHFYYEMM